MKHPVIYAGVFVKVMITLLGSFFFLGMWTVGSTVFATLVALGIVGVCIYNDTLELAEQREAASPSIVCPTCQGTGQVNGDVRFVRHGVLVDLVPTRIFCPCCHGQMMTTQREADAFSAQA